MPRIPAVLAIAALLAQTAVYAPPALAAEPRYYPLPARSGPHDVAPAPDGTVWYMGQRSGALGPPGGSMGRRVGHEPAGGGAGVSATSPPARALRKIIEPDGDEATHP